MCLHLLALRMIWGLVGWGWHFNIKNSYAQLIIQGFFLHHLYIFRKSERAFPHKLHKIVLSIHKMKSNFQSKREHTTPCSGTKALGNPLPASPTHLGPAFSSLGLKYALSEGSLKWERASFSIASKKKKRERARHCMLFGSSLSYLPVHIAPRWHQILNWEGDLETAHLQILCQVQKWVVKNLGFKLLHVREAPVIAKRCTKC